MLDRTSKEKDPKGLILLVQELSRQMERHAAGRKNPSLRHEYNIHISDLLNATIAATHADFGTAQLFDDEQRSLKIVAQHGFEKDFLSYFQTVRDDEGCACSAVLKSRERIVIEDVASNPYFSNGAREIVLRAKVQSVASTPLIDFSGNLIGVVSTHFSRQRIPTEKVWTHVDDLVSNFITAAQ